MDRRFETELEAVRPRVLALARKFFRASSLGTDPEDVVQDVLLRLLEARRRGDEIRNVEAWAVRTTKNCCISVWRKARNVKILPMPNEYLAADSPSSRLEEADAGATVNEALGRLPRGTRELLRLRARGLSLDEMAAVTGRPKGSVKSSISAARRKLMNMINHE